MTLYGPPLPPPWLSPPPTRRPGRRRGPGRGGRGEHDLADIAAASDHITSLLWFCVFADLLSMQWIPPYKFQPSFFSFLLRSLVFKTIWGILGSNFDFKPPLRPENSQANKCVGQSLTKKLGDSALPALFLFWRRRQSGRENVWRRLRRRPKRRRNELSSRGRPSASPSSGAETILMREATAQTRRGFDSNNSMHSMRNTTSSDVYLRIRTTNLHLVVNTNLQI